MFMKKLNCLCACIGVLAVVVGALTISACRQPASSFAPAESADITPFDGKPYIVLVSADDLNSEHVRHMLDDIYRSTEHINYSYIQITAMGKVPAEQVHWIGALGIIESHVDMSHCTVPEGDIPAWAFYRDGELTSINLGSSIHAIKDSAFENCKNLKSITLGAGVDVDAPNAFAGVGDGNFANFYNTNRKAAGTYTWNGSAWQH
jgi:hypothetical protein